MSYFSALRAAEYLDYIRLYKVIIIETYLEEYLDYIRLYKVIHILRSLAPIPSLARENGAISRKWSYFENASRGVRVSAHFLPTYPPGLIVFYNRQDLQRT